MKVTLLVVVALASLASAAYAQGDLELGEQVYDAKCVGCHGNLDRAAGPLEAGVVTPFFVGPRSLYSVSPEGIQAAVLYGVPGTGMVGMGGALSDEEIEALIDYIEASRD